MLLDKNNIKLWEVIQSCERILVKHYNGGPQFEDKSLSDIWDFYGSLKADYKEETGNEWKTRESRRAVLGYLGN